MNILLVIFTALLLFSLYMLVRNFRVYDYRNNMLDSLSTSTHDDIMKGREWRWRLDDYDSVSYDEMMFKFWRRFDSFYPDKSFLDIEVKR